MPVDQRSGTAEDTRPAKATRRRGVALERAILQAAAEELAEVGYQNLTMDRVAARAGTGKNAIYRRWPSRATLSVAAYRQMLPTDPEDTPHTGDLRSDALALLNRANDQLVLFSAMIHRGDRSNAVVAGQVAVPAGMD